MTQQEFAQQIQDWYDTQLATHQGIVNDYASRDFGSGSLNATRRQQSSDLASQIEGWKTRITPLLDAINNGYIDPSQLELAQKYINGDPTSVQGLNELVSSKKLITENDAKLKAFRDAFETRMFGGTGQSLEQAISNPAGDIGQLGAFLRSQQDDVFQKNLSPEISMALGARGLEDSGATLELKTKALGDLERSRQGALMDATMGARNQASGLERTDILGNIGAQQQALANLSDIQRTGITMQFQRELEAQRAQLARELSSYGGASAGGGMFGSLGGAALGAGVGALLAAPTGGMSMGAGALLGGGMGAGFGGMLGNYLSPGYSGNGMSGSGFFAASQALGGSGGDSYGGMPRTGTVQPGGSYGGWMPYY